MKYGKILISAAAALLATACAQDSLLEKIDESVNAPAAVTFTATMEESDDATKTGLKDDTSVVWTKGDAVALFTA
ncbi:MAG: hypothetical protein J5495_02260, partial [Bacteroidales bacterium]|nr:hypothetical protein [Bacteroidales bacterium]